MPQRAPFIRIPVVLVAHAGTWLTRALDSMLAPQGYRVLSVGSGRELLEQAPELGPDVVLLDANLQDVDSIVVCRRLRLHRAVSWHTPVIMITSTPATKQQRLAALEAGAWDYLSLGLNAEELLLKVDAFTRVKLETDHVLEEDTEPESGLYTKRGLERRARELVSDAFRRHAPLACVALSVEADATASPVVVDFASRLLQASGRASDAIGRAASGEFLVLAPSTAPPGAAQMARRLSQAIERGPRPAGLPPLEVRAGFEAVVDLHETPLDPASLLGHASVALGRARSAGNGSRIQRYQA
ncbi:MAG TPA: response regulator [Gemmatimonadales bacterium]|nr:response regulator [Gemmatimonadales bacterium]